MDTNGDGVVDELDDQLATATDTSQQMDTNGDGVVDEQDNATTEAVPGDTNGDGVVDELDAETTTEATKPLYQSQQFNCDPNSATLQVSAKGDKVIELQTYLTDLGYGDLLEPEKIDGKFGPHTKNAVIAYQKDFGLSNDEKGIVGPQTWLSLCDQISLLPTTFPPGKEPPVQPPGENTATGVEEAIDTSENMVLTENQVTTEETSQTEKYKNFVELGCGEEHTDGGTTTGVKGEVSIPVIRCDNNSHIKLITALISVVIILIMILMVRQMILIQKVVIQVERFTLLMN